MNLKQLAILGLAFTTFTTSADAKSRKSRPKIPPVTALATPSTPKVTQAECDYACTQVFEPLYEILKRPPKGGLLH